MSVNQFFRDFFANKLSAVAILYAIAWWVFPQSLGLYNIYADPELTKATTPLYHTGLGIFFILIILKFGEEYFPRRRYYKGKYLEKIK